MNQKQIDAFIQIHAKKQTHCHICGWRKPVDFVVITNDSEAIGIAFCSHCRDLDQNYLTECVHQLIEARRRQIGPVSMVDESGNVVDGGLMVNGRLHQEN